jgi:hypothetical protein
MFDDSAIVQEISCRHLKAEAQVQSQINYRGIYGGQSGTGAGFLREFRFPLIISIAPTLPCSSITRGWYSTPHYTRRNKWTQSHPTLRIKK